MLPKYFWASQADFITKYKNVKRKLQKYNSGICFNKQCIMVLYHSESENRY